MTKLWAGLEQLSLRLCTKLSGADCVPDLSSINIVIVRDTSCHDDHLFQIINKSERAWLSYGSDTNRFH